MRKNPFIKHETPDLYITNDFIVITYEEIKEPSYTRTLNGFIWLDDNSRTPNLPQTVTLNCREHYEFGEDFHCNCFEKGHEEVIEKDMPLEDFIQELYKAGATINDIPENLIELGTYNPNNPFGVEFQHIEEFYRHANVIGFDTLEILQQKFPYIHFMEYTKGLLHEIPDDNLSTLSLNDRPTVLYQKITHTLKILKFKDL